MQEPWLHKGNILVLRTYGQCFSENISDFRDCILVKGVRSNVWAKYCGRVLTTVVIHYGSQEGIEGKGCGLLSLLSE